MYNIVEIATDLELDIKLMVKQAVISVYKAETLLKDITAMLDKELTTVSDIEVKNKVKQTLIKFAVKQWKEICKTYRYGKPMLLLGLGINNKFNLSITALQTAIQNKRIHLDTQTINKGLSNLAESYPTTREAHMPLDSQLEMYKRYEDQNDMITQLKTQTDLVMVSSHANCSKRCAKWQGKVLSLNNKSGVTSDGKKIYPLQRATDVFVTTKSGKVWKNGLLGFNCRHKLLPYKPGMEQPFVSEEQRKIEYGIEQKQRQYERLIRKYKTESRLLEGNVAKQQRAKARQLTKAYEQFSVTNNRPYYKSRIVI